MKYFSYEIVSTVVPADQQNVSLIKYRVTPAVSLRENSPASSQPSHPLKINYQEDICLDLLSLMTLPGHDNIGM